MSGAIEAYRLDRTVRAGLAEDDAGNMSWRHHAAISHLYLGNALRVAGELAQARAELERAASLTDALVKQDPDNTDWQRAAAVARRQLALVAAAEGDLSGALSMLDRAAATLAALVQRDETNTDWRRQLALSRSARSTVLLAARRPVDASQDAASATALLQSLVDQSPADRRSRAELAEALIMDGRIKLVRGDSAGARRSFHRAVDLVAGLVTASFGADVAAPYAKALLHLGETARAQPVVDDLLRRGYRDRELLQAYRERR